MKNLKCVIFMRKKEWYNELFDFNVENILEIKYMIR